MRNLVEMGTEGGSIALDFLENYPDAAAGVVSIIQRDEAQGISYRGLHTTLSAMFSMQYYRDITMFRVNPLNGGVSDKASSLIHQILSKLIDAGLKEALISRLAAQGGLWNLEDLVQDITWMVCTFPYLAKSFILDDGFTARMISCASQTLWHPSQRWKYVTILLQLSYRVTEVCSDEEQASWHHSLIERGFLEVYARLLPSVKPLMRNSSLLWDILSSLPIMQTLLKMERDVVVESEVLEVIERELMFFESLGVEVPFVVTGYHRALNASTILQHFNKLRKQGTDLPHDIDLQFRDVDLS